MSINIITSRVGAATSPFIKTLDMIHPSAPFILLATTSLLASAVCLVLPRTLGKPTREILEDFTSEGKLNLLLLTNYQLTYTKLQS